MPNITWTLTAHELPLRYTWKIARNASITKINLVVQATQAGTSGRGEAAPNVRYGESPELLQQQFAVLLAAGLPRATLAMLESGGHAVNVTEPEAFNQVVLGFLQSR